MRYALPRARAGLCGPHGVFHRPAVSRGRVAQREPVAVVVCRAALVRAANASGKPDKGAQQLEELAARPPPDVICLVVTDKLGPESERGGRGFERPRSTVCGCPLWPVETDALPGLGLRARAKQLGVDMEPTAAQLIVERVEGNLLAAKQELEKLSLLADGKPISAALVLQSVGNSARYDVFQVG